MLYSKLKTDFLEYLEIEQGRSQRTIANYDHYLTRLSDFAGDITVAQIVGKEEDDIRSVSGRANGSDGQQGKNE